MKTRTTILLDDELMERLRWNARYRGVTVTTVIREAVGEYLGRSGVNEGLVELIGMGDALTATGPRAPDKAADELAAAIYEDAMGEDDAKE